MGGHGAQIRKTKYFSIDDIPDELVTQYSKRDPDNLLYKSRTWVNFKKRQILFSQNDGIPLHLRTPARRFLYYGTYIGTFAIFFYNIYVFNKCYSKKN